MSKDVTKDMTTGKPLLLILQFAFPLLIGNFFQQMYNVADAAIVGRFLGPKALAAVGASSSVQFLVLGFCIGICCGFGVPIAQRFGGKDYRSMRAYIWHSIFITIAAAVLLTTICALLCPAILHILTTPANIYKDAYIYLLIIFLGIPCTLLYNLLSSILRAVGDSKTPFLFLVFSTILNIILDLVCIVVFHWGCAGAAIATITAQGISGLLCVYTKEGTDTASNCRGSRFSPTDGIASAYHGDPYGTAIFHYSDRQYGHAVRQQRTG